MADFESFEYITLSYVPEAKAVKPIQIPLIPKNTGSMETDAKSSTNPLSMVNLDTLSVFAAGQLCARESGKRIEYGYIGTVTDSSEGDEGWDSDLMDAIGGDKGQSHNELIRKTVEIIIPGFKKDDSK